MLKTVGRRQAQFFGLLPIDIGEDRRRPGVEQGEHAGKVRVLVGRRNESAARTRACGRARPILQHHLEAARVPKTLNRGRRDRQHIGVFDDRQALSQIGEHEFGGNAWQLVIVKRRQPGEDRCSVGGDG